MQVKQLLTRTAGALGVTAGLLFVGSPLMAQVKIGDNPNTISPNSILELESATKGLLSPRVQLQATDQAAPLTAPIIAGTRVYNTNTTTTGDFTVSPGEYYWDGSSWVRLVTAVSTGLEVYREGAPTVGGGCGADPEGTIWNDITEDGATEGQQWICREGVWAVYNAPNSSTPFLLGTTGTIDAGGRKGGTISRLGHIVSRRSDNGGSTTILAGGAIQMLRTLALAPVQGPYIDFGRNSVNPRLFRIGLRNDLNAGLGALAFNTTINGQTDPRMVIGLNGQVGINTVNPLRTFHVNGKVLVANNNNDGANYRTGTAGQDGILIDWAEATDEANISIQTDGENLSLTKRLAPSGVETFVAFRAAGATLGRIIYNAGDIAFSQTSDRRLKENIKETHYSIQDLMKLDVVDYNYINNPSKTRTVGFIAQDLFKIFPEAVAIGGEDVKANPWTVNYTKLTPLLVKAIQDQQKEIQDQQKEIAALKAQLSEMNTLKAEVASIKAMLGNAAQQNSEATISK
ncbi:Chaperone of endosialidase [Dyadobacter soli]|uniref:Chaperone of endosialidase n=1 Tax=Dyadobacter soli TaxID=659014 RepID=A0A1G7EB72_9BACT|nr:tail fiber domain-containing protein [Dyadobacter soli]SDE60964.1 Chaperone of endosialidase [Dyadobacter soli]